MSTASTKSRYAAVTPLPLVVAYPPINLQKGLQDDRVSAERWVYELLEGFADCDYIELPTDASADVLSLNKTRIRKLERGFDVKLSSTEVAEIFHFAKLIDALRLAGDSESRRMCLLALEKAHGKEQREFMEELFEGKHPLADDILNSHFRWICFVSRLGLIFPKECAEPEIAIVAPNLFEGIRMQILLSLHQPRAAAHCEHCGRAYIRHRQEQRFCSERCASAERQARFRANKLKGAKHGQR